MKIIIDKIIKKITLYFTSSIAWKSGFFFKIHLDYYNYIGIVKIFNIIFIYHLCKQKPNLFAIFY